MNDAEQRKAARKFVQDWTGRGDEKQDTQRFWIQLLREVLGVDAAEQADYGLRRDRDVLSVASYNKNSVLSARFAYRLYGVLYISLHAQQIVLQGQRELPHTLLTELFYRFKSSLRSSGTPRGPRTAKMR